MVNSTAEVSGNGNRVLLMKWVLLLRFRPVACVQLMLLHRDSLHVRVVDLDKFRYISFTVK